MRSKTKRVIVSVGVLRTRYLCGFTRLRLSEDIGDATGYRMLSPVYMMIARKKYNIEFRYSKLISMRGLFDAKIEYQLPGIRGFINKTLLKIIRILDDKRIKQ